MSMDYWGVVLYGVAESWLTKTDKTDCFYDIQEMKNTCDFTEIITTPDGHEIEVNLWMELAENENYIGFLAGYPWEFNQDDEMITPKIVVKAISQFLEPYGYNPKEIESEIDYISTHNCG